MCSDPELLERAPHLRGTVVVDLAALLGGVEIMRAAIGVEAHRQAVRAEHLLERAKGRGRALLLDEKRRIDLPRRVVHRHDEIERRLAREPIMPRAVLMQHHPRQRPPHTLAPMRPLARRLGQKPLRLQEQLGPGVAPAKAVVPDQMLVKVLGGEAEITLPVERLHFLLPVDRNPLARRLAQSPVEKPGLAFLLVTAKPAPKRPLAHSQYLRRLRLVQLRPVPTAEKLNKTRHAHTLKNLRPAQPALLKRSQSYRTDRALPKPVISSATDTH